MWTERDERMLSSIETELLTLIDAYEFAYENPNVTQEEIFETQQAVQFKNKQIEWLCELKNRVNHEV